MKTRGQQIFAGVSLLIMAAILIWITIDSFAPVEKTKLIELPTSKLDGYVKECVYLEPEDYIVLSYKEMWKDYQSNGVTDPTRGFIGYYPIMVRNNTGENYIIGLQLRMDEAEKYLTGTKTITGNLLRIKDKWMDDYNTATAGQNAYPYFISAKTEMNTQRNKFGSIICGMTAILFGLTGAALVSVNIEKNTKQKQQ